MYYSYSNLSIPILSGSSGVFSQVGDLTKYTDLRIILIMANGTISATNARTKLYDLLEEVDSFSKRITITRHGKAKAVLLNPDELESLEETLEILKDKRALTSIKKSMQEIRRGKIIPLETATR